MYLSDIFTIPVNLAGLPGALDPVRVHRGPACRSGCSSSAGPSTRRRCCARPHAYEQRDRLAHAREPRRSSAMTASDRAATTKPSSGSRSTPSSRRATKMFCGCSADLRRARRTPRPARSAWACPASLPVLNRRAVEFGDRDRAGARLHGSTRVSRFARKNYFYPDMPKDYQISQYEQPLAEHGRARRSTSGGGPRAIGDPAHPPGGGRRQDHPRGRARDRDVEPASTSTAPACRCSRSSPSPTCAAPEEAAAYLRTLRAILHLPRRLRRQHGGGLLPLRRQRLAPAARRRPSSAPRSRSRT